MACHAVRVFRLTCADAPTRLPNPPIPMRTPTAKITAPAATEWMLLVAGHDDYRRDIDAKTCALVRSWAGSSSAPGPRASPTPTPSAKGS